MSRRIPDSPYGPDAFVSWRPDGDGYGVVRRSWEDGARTQRVTREGAEGVAEGFDAEFRAEAGW